MRTRALYFLSLILAFCSFSYEILMAFVAAKVTGFEIISQTFCIGSFILGLGLAAFWIERHPPKDKVKFLFWVELGLSVMGGLSVFYIFGLDMLFKVYLGGVPAVVFFLFVQIYIFLIGILSGFELPCLLDLQTDKKNHNFMLGFHYLGTLVAAVLIFAYLIPKIDVLFAAIFIALFNAAVAFSMVFYGASGLKRLVPLLGVSLLLVSLIKMAPHFYAQHLKIYYFEPRAQSLTDYRNVVGILHYQPDIERYRSKYQYIDIIEKKRKGEEAVLMFLDHHYQFSSSHEFVYHEQMVHVPIELYDRPLKKVLILGGGDGLIARELLKHKNIEEIRLIELDEEILNFSIADHRLVELNQSSMTDPRVKVQIQDALSFVRKSNEKFDAVFLDFPYPNNYELTKLYSVEFYKSLRKRMKPHAFMVLDYPIDRSRDGSLYRNEVILSTLHYAGFKAPVVFGKEDTYVMASLDNQLVDTEKELELEKLHERSRRELLFRTRLVEDTRIIKGRVNSIFKPRALRKKRAGW